MDNAPTNPGTCMCHQAIKDAAWNFHRKFTSSWERLKKVLEQNGFKVALTKGPYEPRILLQANKVENNSSIFFGIAIYGNGETVCNSYCSCQPCRPPKVQPEGKGKKILQLLRRLLK